jgi:hypothetical protein
LGVPILKFLERSLVLGLKAGMDIVWHQRSDVGRGSRGADPPRHAQYRRDR